MTTHNELLAENTALRAERAELLRTIGELRWTADAVECATAVLNHIRDDDPTHLLVARMREALARDAA